MLQVISQSSVDVKEASCSTAVTEKQRRGQKRVEFRRKSREAALTCVLLSQEKTVRPL